MRLLLLLRYLFIVHAVVGGGRVLSPNVLMPQEEYDTASQSVYIK